jgi:mRNA-degrading endonuclease RelE of RelBE toxin-antitoxin system
VKSVITKSFRALLSELPINIQEKANDAYLQFQQNPNHPSLRFKKVHSALPIYSVRITKNYRAVGQLDGDAVIWFWIGSHKEYDRLLSQL